MPHRLNFSCIYQYDSRKVGIEIPIELVSGSRKIHLPAKIDTGASSCIFERRYAAELDISLNPEAKKEFSTATGYFYAYGHEVTLYALGLEMNLLVYFAEDEDFHRNVLGRQGWLDRVRLGLVDYDSTIYLGHYNEDHE